MAKTGANVLPWKVSQREGHPGQPVEANVSVLGDHQTGITTTVGLMCLDAVALWDASDSAITNAVAGAREELKDNPALVKWRRVRAQQAERERQAKILTARLGKYSAEKAELLAEAPADLPQRLVLVNEALGSLPAEIEHVKAELGALADVVASARRDAEREIEAALLKTVMAQRSAANEAYDAAVKALPPAIAGPITDIAIKLLTLRRISNFHPREHTAALLTIEDTPVPAAQPAG